MKPRSQFEFVLPDTKESEFHDLVDFRGGAFSVETVVGTECVYVLVRDCFYSRIREIRDQNKRDYTV